VVAEKTVETTAEPQTWKSGINKLLSGRCFSSTWGEAWRQRKKKSNV